MKLRLLSDLHLNLRPWKYSYAEEDAVLIAGDTIAASPEDRQQLIGLLSSIPVPVYIISGNHEVYGVTQDASWPPIGLDSYTEFLAGYVSQCKLSHVHWLNASCADLDENTIIFGATLYTDFCAAGISEQPYVELAWSNTADAKQMPVAKTEYIRLATRHRQAMVDCLLEARRCKKSVVVMTHWVPSLSLVAKRYCTAAAQMNAVFVCDCDTIINEFKDVIKLWHYGHSHARSFTVKNGVTFVNNPRGYCGERTGWKPKCVVNI